MSVELQQRLFTVDEYHAMARAGVPEVWLVDLGEASRESSVAVFRSPTPDGYAESRIFERDDVLRTERLPDVAIPVEAILG